MEKEDSLIDFSASRKNVGASDINPWVGWHYLASAEEQCTFSRVLSLSIGQNSRIFPERKAHWHWHGKGTGTIGPGLSRSMSISTRANFMPVPSRDWTQPGRCMESR
jgi:hypothetical protein